jgi:hypothetical protein
VANLPPWRLLKGEALSRGSVRTAGQFLGGTAEQVLDICRITWILHIFGEARLIEVIQYFFIEKLSSILKSMENTLTQQWKCCSTIHHPFNEFELVHFSFDHACKFGN